MKQTAIILLVETVVVALSLTAYKKNLRANKAKKHEIVGVAIILSVLLTISLAFGVPFTGIPYTVPAYVVAVFFLQWLVSQQVIDVLWKAVKAFIEKKIGIKIEDPKKDISQE